MNLMPILVIVFFFQLFSCGENPKQDRFLPETLPSEEVVKLSLSSDSNLAKLREVANIKGQTLTEWKESERSFVTDQEISKYWSVEKKILPREISDTDSIDRLRESIRIRIVWSRLFHKSGLKWKEKSYEIGKKEILAKLNLKSSPKFGSSSAKWVVIEWSDYLCNFCRETFPHTKNILSKYKSQIFYIHKDFPLDGDSEEGLLPLALGRCLWEKDPERFTFHMQGLYANAKKIYKGEDLYVSEWGSYPDCQPQNLKSIYFEKVRIDMKEAAALGVNSVPSFWVNGRWVVGALNAETWERVLKDTMSH
ncbi:thioredoxin domain-containing protein [Leptospira kanakyensis]|uniref:thioredoxin domain-containing protein n=1 Tax=Leptospira kanakyensis TaxID=2484968 RepID=UPI002AC7F48C|nr:thioredoxin domain-containing protein [Leptospira kanakyensis]